jgi:hypothetical protein
MTELQAFLLLQESGDHEVTFVSVQELVGLTSRVSSWGQHNNTDVQVLRSYNNHTDGLHGRDKEHRLRHGSPSSSTTTNPAVLSTALNNSKSQCLQL